MKSQSPKTKRRKKDPSNSVSCEECLNKVNANLDSPSCDAFLCSSCEEARCFDCALGKKLSRPQISILKLSIVSLQCARCKEACPPCQPSSPGVPAPAAAPDASTDSPPDSAPRPPSSALSARVDSLEAKLTSLCDFILPKPTAGKSYASAAAKGVPNLPSNLTSQFIYAQKLSLEEAERSRAVVIAGLPYSDAEDVAASCQELIADLGLSQTVKVEKAYRLPKAKTSATNAVPIPADAPPLTKLILMDENMQLSLLRSATNLQRIPSRQNVFIRKARSKDELAVIRERIQRRAQLNANAPPGTLYKIDYRHTDFCIYRVINDSRDKNWSDNAPDAAAPAPAAPQPPNDAPPN